MIFATCASLCTVNNEFLNDADYSIEIITNQLIRHFVRLSEIGPPKGTKRRWAKRPNVVMFSKYQPSDYFVKNMTMFRAEKDIARFSKPLDPETLRYEFEPLVRQLLNKGKNS